MEPQTTSYTDLLTWARPELVTKQNYARLCSKLEKLMAAGGTNPGSALSKIINLLSKLLNDYEAETFTQPTVSGREILKHIIEQRGENRAEFARAMEIRPQVISNVLNGQREISKKLAFRLAEKLHLEPTIFLSIE